MNFEDDTKLKEPKQTKMPLKPYCNFQDIQEKCVLELRLTKDTVCENHIAQCCGFAFDFYH